MTERVGRRGLNHLKYVQARHMRPRERRYLSHVDASVYSFREKHAPTSGWTDGMWTSIAMSLGLQASRLTRKRSAAVAFGPR